VPQRIAAISYEQLPIDATVLFDVSGSVTGGVMDQLRHAIVDLRKSLRPEDRLRLVTFNMRVRQVLEAGASDGAVDLAFAHMTSGGGSAVYDALVVALASGGTPDRRSLVVLFSDGRDTRSVTREDVLLDLARAAVPTVSVVLAAPSRSSSDRVYRDVAAETGGTVVSLLPTDTLGGSLRGALEQFRSSYVLTYSPTGVVRVGAHAIGVNVNRPGLDVRARRGYVVR
jgi:VWFA-related protein